MCAKTVLKEHWKAAKDKLKDCKNDGANISLCLNYCTGRTIL